MKNLDKTHMATLSQGMNKLKAEGYNVEFQIREDGHLLDPRNGNTYTADQGLIKTVLRYEGNSNPSDMSVLYGLQMKDGTKGLLIDAFGAQSNKAMAEFITRVEREK